MPQRLIELQIYPQFHGKVPLTWLRRVVNTTLTAADPGGNRGASVVVADDATLRDLNMRYLGADETTDVLAFPTDELDNLNDTVPFPTIWPADSPFGEVLISFPQALRQAQSARQSVHREVAHLVVHGLLHLLGHDHALPKERAMMRTAEQNTLATIFPITP